MELYSPPCFLRDLKGRRSQSGMNEGDTVELEEEEQPVLLVLMNDICCAVILPSMFRRVAAAAFRAQELLEASPTQLYHCV